MVDMQVRAQDHVDVLGRDTRGPQSFEPRPVAAVEGWALAGFVISTAGIDENGQPFLADQETLNADDQISPNPLLKKRHGANKLLMPIACVRSPQSAKCHK